jgi:two-component system phosphate regulon sensor histidine kinase PhoR
MNDTRYKWILYTIVTVIVITIGIQIYWNYKNYQANKQQLINEVQISLDKAVDDYYTDLAKQTTMGFSFEGVNTDSLFIEGGAFSDVLKDIDKKNGQFRNLDSIDVSKLGSVTIVRGREVDSMMNAYNKSHKTTSIDSLKAQVKELRNEKDSLNLSNIEMLTSKVVISIKNDSLDIEKVYNLVKQELNRKNINVDYDLAYYNVLKNEESKSKNTIEAKRELLTTVSKSAFLPKKSTLKIEFFNETRVILKRIFGGILISGLLILAVISCLFYLLRIIKHQKHLAEVKNDLISNITHEFKTPIATIGAALEGISNFNAIEDKAKTKKYVSMSSQQLTKLNDMVEKLLETATLDSDHLELNTETIDLVELLNTLVSRYKIQFQDKTFDANFKVEQLLVNVDVFHFENALNNIIDNAVKYGGDMISIDLEKKQKSFEISISDNGNTLTKANKERIFEKFYRVPKGNTHDVKGFGIGLYYTKTIIDKHDGTIALDINSNRTIFKISLPNG